MASKKLGHLASEIALLKHGFANKKRWPSLLLGFDNLCCAHSLSEDGYFESQAASQRDCLFLGQGAPKFLVLPDQMPHRLGLEHHPIRHLGNCAPSSIFAPPISAQPINFPLVARLLV